MDIVKLHLDELHTMHLNVHGWVMVDDYIVVKENDDNYYLSKVVNKAWEMKLQANETSVKEVKIEEEY